MEEGRDASGRFAKGHKLSNGNGGGRPKRSVEERCLATLAKTVTDEDLQKVFASGLSRAMAGDVAWAKLLLGYLIGLPIQRTEVSGPEGGRIEIDTGIDANDIAEALAILGGGNGCSCR